MTPPREEPRTLENRYDQLVRSALSAGFNDDQVDWLVDHIERQDQRIADLAATVQRQELENAELRRRIDYLASKGDPDLELPWGVTPPKIRETTPKGDPDEGARPAVPDRPSRASGPERSQAPSEPQEDAQAPEEGR